MSWMRKMYETYNRCEAYIGKDGENRERPLVPVGHHLEKAQIEITIDQNGNLLEANLVKDKNPYTIVPCTEDSAAKARDQQPHPLSEKLKYVAGDFLDYVDKEKDNGKRGKKKDLFPDYEKLLVAWCTSEFSHPKAQAVLNYVKKRTVAKDLVERKLLLTGSDGKLIKKYANGATFIRWIVSSDNVEDVEKTWKDPSLWKKWEEYYFTVGATGEKELCMITGNIAVSAKKHPKFIRTSNDGAKLISSDDKDGFTYRGRFEDAEQAFTVSLEATQKAHSTLKWLIDRQGHVFFEVDPKSKKPIPRLTVLAWAVTDEKIPKPTSGSVELMNESEPPTTKQDFAEKFKNIMLGYSSKLKKDEARGLQVMAMDSAVLGRSALTYYRELESLDYFERLEKWHNGCGWLQKGFDEKTKKYFDFFGAPSPLSIAEAAYGKKADDKIKNATVARLLPCIVDNQAIPDDIVSSAVRRASNRIGFQGSKKKGEKKDKDENEWKQTLSIACSLYKKSNEEKEIYDMELDEKNTSRDYLYGRLLAIADYLEERVLRESKKSRATNAARYMQRFSQYPYRTWFLLQNDLLRPYILQLKRKAFFYTNLIEEVGCKFEGNDFKKDTPLSGEYLIGFYCQKQSLCNKPKSTSDNSDVNNNKQDSDQ